MKKLSGLSLSSRKPWTINPRKLIKEPAQRTQPCPQCGNLIGNIAGSKKAICQNCGFKDPCCD